MGVVATTCMQGWGMQWQTIPESFDWSPAARLVIDSPPMFELTHYGLPIHSVGTSIFYSDTIIAAHSHIVDIAHLSPFPLAVPPPLFSTLFAGIIKDLLIAKGLLLL